MAITVSMGFTPGERPRPASRQPRAGHAARRTTVSTRLDERQLEPVRIGDHEHAAAPRHVLRFLIEDAAARLDVRGYPIEVLRRVAIEPPADALLPVASFGEIVLPEHERHRASVDFTACQLAVLAPFVADDESEDIAIEGHAT